MNAELHDEGGFILPFSAIRDTTSGLYNLLQHNRQTIARYGKYLNWPGVRELCETSSGQVLVYLEDTGRYSTKLYVNRDSVNSVLYRFLLGKAPILPIIGQTGTGKTNCSAHITKVLKHKFATVLLLAYRLSVQPEGLAASVAANLSKTNTGMPALSPTDFMSAVAASPESNLIVILDGLNELPGTIKEAREWIESTCAFLRNNANVRLVVTCRPEYWSSAKEYFERKLLYAEPSSEERQAPSSSNDQSFQLGKFTDEEAREAGRLYGMPVKGRAPIFRHPLFYGIAQGLLSGTAISPSINQVFRAYIERVVNDIRKASLQPPSPLTVRSMLEGLARTVRTNKSLWINSKQFLAVSTQTFLADAFLSEHLLVEGDDAVRFAYDETAHYLVAESAAVEFQSAASAGIDWANFYKDDPMGADSLPFFLARLEDSDGQELVMQVLNSLARERSIGNDLEYPQLFVRLLQWLTDPSMYVTPLETMLGKFLSYGDFITQLADLAPDLVVNYLKYTIGKSSDRYRRELAVRALSDAAKRSAQKVLPLLSELFGRYPELSIDLALAVEQVFYSIKPDSPDAERLQTWVRENFVRVPVSCRRPIIFGVLYLAEKASSGQSLLQDVIEAETSEGNLTEFLRLLPKARMPRETSLELLKRVAARLDRGDPRAECLIYSVMVSMDNEFGKYLADQIASAPSKWSESQVQFSRLVASGRRPFDAANEILTALLKRPVIGRASEK